MPITAKLSRQFYDKFGNAVVDELVNWFNQIDTTYKSELRELNDLNWARFEAKLDQRLAELRLELGALRFELRGEFKGDVASTQACIARVEGGLLARIGQAEGRLARLTVALWLATMGTVIALVEL